MSNRSFYDARVIDFLSESMDSIIGKITQNHTQELVYQQTGAWLSQIRILQDSLKEFCTGHIFFEVQIPRMGRRADIVLIANDIIFVIEFKNGASQYNTQDLRQTHGYAIDLHHFHEGSHDKTIIPVLIATEAQSVSLDLSSHKDNVYDPICGNKKNLFELLSFCLNKVEKSTHIDVKEWIKSAYKPTPTIIEAAQALYSNHDVSDIARNDAGAQNLNVTSTALKEIIHQARVKRHKAICFVTGVPGAGKTLVGLNIATSNLEYDDEHAVFLSGNGPLVNVLTEALARDSKKRNADTSKAAELRSASAKIQNIHKFRDESLKDLTKAPPERVVIFDEAQRAWDLENTKKFMNQKRRQIDFSQSEPDFLISVMDRHEDWCVIVALIGGGQEINTGEAGLQGWIDALQEKYLHWKVYFSNKLSQIEYAGREVNFDALKSATSSESLHLATAMRSFRAEKLSHMVHYLIHNQKQSASACNVAFSNKFPVLVTRDLVKAKTWINSQARANETKGLIASSGAIRLKPEGIFVKNKITAADWFLNTQEDIRSCHFLEDVCTEFDIQGLELDWCLVGWDADYRYRNGKFEHWKFTGATWKRRNQEEQKRYLENAYRVLLTRARQGLIIFIPRGNFNDATRLPEFYDETFEYLITCGIKVLE